MPWRVYRPAIVVGHSETGAMDKVDGPYYFFPLLKRLRDNLPHWLPLVGIDLGDTNVVPVDYVAKAMDHLAHLPDLDGQAFHLVNPEPQPTVDLINTFAEAARRPTFATPVDRRVTGVLPGCCSRAPCARLALMNASCAPRPAQAGARRRSAGSACPPEVLEHTSFFPDFASRRTEQALAGSGIAVPDLEGYAADAVGLLGGEPRRGHRPRPAQPRRAQGQVRRDHRRLLGHRPGHRAQGGAGRRHPGAGRPRQGQARGDPGRDRAARRHGPRLPVRPVRPRGHRRAVRADHRRAAGRSTSWSTTPAGRSGGRSSCRTTGSTTSSAPCSSTTSARSGWSWG